MVDPHEELPVTEHIEELRQRIFRSVIAIVIGFFVAWPFKEKILPSGIIVPTYRKDIPHFKAEVVMSGRDDVMVGDWVLCPKSAPLKHEEGGVEYYLLNEEDIWYVWNE